MEQKNPYGLTNQQSEARGEGTHLGISSRPIGHLRTAVKRVKR